MAMIAALEENVEELQGAVASMTAQRDSFAAAAADRCGTAM
jgi:hypothetical protein